MKRPLACADFSFPLLAHEQVLDLVAMLGFDGVDVGLFEKRSHLWPSREFADLARSAKALKRQLARRNLRMADLFLQTDPDFTALAINHPQAARRRKARQWFLHTLDYAGLCDCRHVTILPGVYFSGEPRRDGRQRACDELAWRLERARRHDITCSIEAHVGSIAPNPQAAARLVRDVPGLTLTLDYTHFTRRGIADAQVEPLIAHASHFHARGARRGRLQASFQHNTIDYARVLRAMDQANYRGYIGVEYVWIDWQRCNEVDNLSETILMRDFLRKRMSE